MDTDYTLAKLLHSLFSTDELRRWLRRVPGGEDIVGRLPWASLAPVQLFEDVADMLARDGLLATPDLWVRLVAARPQRKADIDRARGRLLSAPTPADPPGPGSAPERLTVLMVSASPETVVRVRVDREFAQIIARMRGTRHRDRFRFEQVQAARFDDLRTALMEHQPHILHISGHGEPDGSLVFESDGGGARTVPRRTILKLLESLREDLRLVVINACDSHQLARAIPPAIDLAIGMSEEVSDRSAINFSASFYEGLGFGKSVEVAFQVALTSLDERSEQVPQLFPSAADDPHDRRKLLLAPRTPAG